MASKGEALLKEADGDISEAKGSLAAETGSVCDADRKAIVKVDGVEGEC